MEREIENIHGHCEGNGEAVERMRIVFASELPECECCGEPWCAIHMEHYTDCDCIGPSNAEDLGYKIEEINGILYATK